MSDVVDETDETDLDDETAARPRRKLSGKKLVLLYILPAFLLLGCAGGGAYYYFFALSPETTVAGQDGTVEEDLSKVVFYDLPDILVNLNSGGKQNNYLKISIALELGAPEDASLIDAVLPRIIDNFQIYLRELRIEDLNGSAGPMRLKEELLSRLNASLGGRRINDILFKEMLVQ